MRRVLAFRSQWSTGPAPWLLILSISAYIVILLWPKTDSLVQICGRTDMRLMEFVERVGMMPPIWSVRELALDWTLMCVAMMSLLISPPTAYIWRSVGNKEKLLSVISFYAGFIGFWILSGILLCPTAIILAANLGSGNDLSFALGLAVFWSATPLAQSARNRCHAWSRVNAFGVWAQIDSGKLGVRTGLNCFLVCWPWMLVPAFVQNAHFLMMFLVSFYLFADRIAPADQVQWRLPPAINTVFGHGLLRLWSGSRTSSLFKLNHNHESTEISIADRNQQYF